MRLCVVYQCEQHVMAFDKPCCAEAVSAGWIELLTPETIEKIVPKNPNSQK